MTRPAPAPGGRARRRRLWEALGAHLACDQSGCTFSVWAPHARAVSVVGDWNAWDGSADPLHRVGDGGVWTGFAAAVRPGARYRFAVVGADGHVRRKADPLARAAEAPPATASVVMGPSRHRWHDAAWMAARARAGPALRIYELHLASWRPGLGYREVAGPLADHVHDLGFTHVELLPLAEHPYPPSWGYQATGYYAPTARLGAPDDLRATVDHLHQHGIGVLMDWVPTEFAADDFGLGCFDGTPLYERPGSFSFDQQQPEVRAFLVANAVYWLGEFHLDGLRIVGGEGGDELGGLRAELSAAVAAEHPGAVLVDDGSGASGEADATTTHRWATGWTRATLGYFGHDPVHRRWHHDEVVAGLAGLGGDGDILALGHDEVAPGKGSLLAKLPGDEWQRFANLRALYAWQWACPGSPLVFAGAELAQWHEWSIDRGVDWDALAGARHCGVRDLVRALNHAAAAHPCLQGGALVWLDADDRDRSTFAFVRTGGDGGDGGDATEVTDAVVCVANLVPLPQEVYRVGLPTAGEWQVLIDTNAVNYGGSGYGGGGRVWAGDTPHQGQPASAVLTLPPLAVVWLGMA